MKRRVSVLVVVALALACIMLRLAAGPRFWKLYMSAIPHDVLQDVEESHDYFVGQAIQDALSHIAKGDTYLVITREYQGYPPYQAIIAQFPELALEPPREKLYCIPIRTRIGDDATYAVGYFVDEKGRILERSFRIPFAW